VLEDPKKETETMGTHRISASRWKVAPTPASGRGFL
jgi:hypothetical protein